MAADLVSNQVRQAVEDAMRTANVPGMLVALVRGEQPPAYLALGSDARGQPIAHDSLFPVASITKLATTLAVLRLVEENQLALDDQLSDHLPDALAAQYGVTIRTLLCHTSGVPLDISAGGTPYALGLDWPQLRAACLETPLQQPPSTRVQYSNVGFGLLGALVEQLAEQPFAAALQALVLGPLGIEGYLGVEPPRAAVALSDVRSSHRGTALEPFNSAFWRALALPWAGLLTTADGALRLVRAFGAGPAQLLRPETRAEAISSQTGDLAGGFAGPLLWSPCPWGLGADLRGNKAPHWVPAQAGAASFGHSGGSGCLAWVAESGVAWAILGARTADSGWLLRRAPAIGTALLEYAG